MVRFLKASRSFIQTTGITLNTDIGSFPPIKKNKRMLCALKNVMRAILHILVKDQYIVKYIKIYAHGIFPVPSPSVNRPLCNH